MIVKSRGFIFSLSTGIVMSLLATSLQAGTTTVIINDSWADGDLAATGTGGELDSSWWTSSSSSADEVTTGAMGLVTGTSGRGLHTTFATQSLLNVGDTITATYSFTTPATVGTNRTTAFKVGLFDHLDRLTTNPANAGIDPNDTRRDECCLDAAVNASSGSPNVAYGHGLFASNNPDASDSLSLPGFQLDMDVNPTTAASADLNFREHNVNTLTGTGRLMGTTGNFTNISPSGPDAGYVFVGNSDYVGSFSVTKGTGDRFKLTATLEEPGGTIHTYTNFTSSTDAGDFGFLGFHANSNTFGSSNAADDATTLTNDNGINFTNITVTFSTPEPTSFVLLLMGLPAIAGR
ncbi:MAG: hypothetical protein RID07_05315, partial [Lacipirellulaceae bacterium]